MASGTPLLPTITINVPEPNCCQQVVCCSSSVKGNFNNPRIIYSKGRFMAEEEESCWRKWLCCCRQKSAEQLKRENIEVLKAFKTALADTICQGGAVIVDHYHLKPKIQKGEPLCLKDKNEMEAVARKVKNQDLPPLRQHFDELRLYSMYHHSPVGQREDVPALMEKPTVYIVSDQGKTLLDHENLKQMILKLKTTVPIGSDRGTKIAEQVFCRICKEKVKEVEVSKDDLNRVIVAELKRNGISLVSPSISEHLARVALIDDILGKSCLDQLSEKEFCELYAAMEVLRRKTTDEKVDAKVDT